MNASTSGRCYCSVGTSRRSPAMANASEAFWRCSLLRAAHTHGNALPRLLCRPAGHRRMHFVVRSSTSNNSSPSGGEGPGGKPDLQTRLREARLNSLVITLTTGPGLTGTLAVLIGFYAGLDPFGRLHFDAHDMAIGLALMAPVMALDAAMMLPDYTPKVVKRTIRLPKPRGAAASAAAQSNVERVQAAARAKALAEDGFGAVVKAVEALEADKASSSSSGATSEVGSSSRSAASVDEQQAAAVHGEALDEGMEYVTREIKVRQPQPPLVSALRRLQQRRVLGNQGLTLDLSGEALTILVGHTANEMLQRAVIVAGVSSWLTDRLYEADVPELFVPLPMDVTPQLLLRVVANLGGGGTLSVAGGAQGLGLAPAELAAWLTLAGGAAVWAALTARKLLAPRPFKVVSSAALSKGGDAGGSGDAAADAIAGTSVKKPKTDKQKRVLRQASKALEEVRLRSAFAILLEEGRDLLEWLLLGTAFIITGNLAASLAGSVATDLLFSAYQRAKLQAATEAQAKQLKEMMSLLGAARDGALPDGGGSGPDGSGAGPGASSGTVAPPRAAERESDKVGVRAGIGGSGADAAPGTEEEEPASSSSRS